MSGFTALHKLVNSRLFVPSNYDTRDTENFVNNTDRVLQSFSKVPDFFVTEFRMQKVSYLHSERNV